jgi:hypothetical protein
MVERNIDGNVVGWVGFLLFLVVFLTLDKMIWLVEVFLRGLAALKG